MNKDISSIKYVFCDLDGTLLDDRKKLSKNVLQAIHIFKEKTKLSFGIASGRALTSLLPLLQKKGLLEDIDVIIANNGVDVYIPKTKELQRRFMLEPQTIQEILTQYKDEHEVNICFHNPNVFYAQKVTQRVTWILERNQIEVVFHPNHDEDYTQTPRVMLLFDPLQREYIEKLVQGKSFKGVRGIFSENDIYEYVHEDVAKDAGIKSYVESFGDTLDDVMGIGDSYNDEEMLRECGLGIAMKNAKDEVKSFADIVSSHSNNEDGVAHILTTYWKLDNI